MKGVNLFQGMINYSGIIYPRGIIYSGIDYPGMNLLGDNLFPDNGTIALCIYVLIVHRRF